MRKKKDSKQLAIDSFLTKTSRHDESTTKETDANVSVKKTAKKSKSSICNSLEEEGNKDDHDAFMQIENNNESSNRDAVPAKKANKKASRVKMDPMEEFFRSMLEVSVDAELRLRHSLFPAFNVRAWPMTDANELKNYPGCVLAAPRPVYVAKTHCDLFDICHRRTMAYKHYTKLLHHSQTRFKTVYRTNRQFRALQKQNIFHTSVFDLAERLHRHPDIYFHGQYDYYYSGGNMCVLSGNDDEQYVVHVDGKNLENLNVAHVRHNKQRHKARLRSICSKSFSTGGEIFEVLPLLNPRKNDKPCIAVRQRNKISLECFDSDNDRFKSLAEFTTQSTPYISMAQSTIDPHMFVVSNMKQQLRWFDVKKKVSTLRMMYNLNEPKVVSSWNSVRAWREHTFVYANEKSVLMMDVRTTQEEWLKTACGFPPDEFSCDYISSLCASGFKNLLYVGTHHKLHCLDVRYMGRHLEQPGGAISRWTHQMEFAPAFVNVFSQENTEFVALASALAGDMRICELTRQRNIEKYEFPELSKPPRYIYKSQCLPFQPPTLQEAYESARLAGKCLQPDADIANRIRRCTTGMTFYTPTELLLTATSSGDIFAQTVSQRESQESEERTNCLTDEQMDKYAKMVGELMTPNLNYTEVIDMKPISKVFRCSNLSAPPEEKPANMKDMEDNKIETAKPQRRRLGRWQKSIEALHSFKDALVPNLLSVWDIEFKETTSMTLPLCIDEKPDHKNIVNSWLETHEAAAPMLSIPRLNVSGAENYSLTDDLFDDTFDGVPQSTQYMDDTFTPMDSSNLAPHPSDPQTTVASWTKKSKTKKKYVKGF